MAVIVAEDEDQLRLLAGDAFAKEEFYVVEAGDAEEAVAALEADGSAIDVLFTDIHMPGPVSGIMLAQYVREKWPWIKVVLTSGRAQPDDVPEGCVFIAKPYRLSRVIGQIRRMIDNG